MLAGSLCCLYPRPRSVGLLIWHPSRVHVEAFGERNRGRIWHVPSLRGLHLSKISWFNLIGTRNDTEDLVVFGRSEERRVGKECRN